MTAEEIRQSSIEATKKSNAEFALMSPADKRVTLAKDVLMQLATKRFRAAGGNYLDFRSYIPLTAEDIDRDLSELLPQVEACDVCAIGGLFVCAVERADKLKVGHRDAIERGGVELSDLSYDEHGYVAQFFDRDTRYNMETMFEQCFCDGEDGDRVYMPARWRETFHDRMTWIMKNVIENGGNFRPTWDTLDPPWVVATA